jgi:hypothetical protein
MRIEPLTVPGPKGERVLLRYGVGFAAESSRRGAQRVRGRQPMTLAEARRYGGICLVAAASAQRRGKETTPLPWHLFVHVTPAALEETGQTLIALADALERQDGENPA